MYTNLKEVYLDVAQCTRCSLCRTRHNTVFGEGSVDAGIMFIGEGPGEQEDLTGRPFVGPAGQLLDKMLASIGFKREDVFIANIVKCRPPFNADPREEYVSECIGYLREQIRFIRPKLIVCLGKVAAVHVLKEPLSIMRQHGKIFARGNFTIIPTFHPSALLRDESLKRPAWEDFKIIRDTFKELSGE